MHGSPRRENGASRAYTKLFNSPETKRPPREKVDSSKQKQKKEICPVRGTFSKVGHVLVTKRYGGKTSLKCRRIFRSTERSFISAVATFDFET